MYPIQIKNLTKKYLIKQNFKDYFNGNFKKKYLIALHNISFNVHENEILGLIGLNGAGKTTLLKIFSSLLIPDKGSIRIFNYDLHKDPENIKRLIGLINSEERSFYWRLTVKQNLEFFASLYGLDKKNFNHKINDLMKLVDLLDKKDARFDSLSTGMRQRLAIARGLLSDPKILLLDEPTKGLDIKHAEAIRKIIKKISKNKTIILTSHNLNEISELCDRVVIIHNGKIIKSGKFKNVENTFKRII